MLRVAVLLCLVCLPALADDLTVGVGEVLRLPATSRVVARDPALLDVLVDGADVAVFGKAPGVTGISVRRANGDLERILVTVTEAPTVKAARPESAAATKKVAGQADKFVAAITERAIAESFSALPSR